MSAFRNTTPGITARRDIPHRATAQRNATVVLQLLPPNLKVNSLFADAAPRVASQRGSPLRRAPRRRSMRRNTTQRNSSEVICENRNRHA